MFILWLFHIGLLILDVHVLQKLDSLGVRGKGYYIFLQSFAANSVLFLLGKFADDNSDFLFQFISNFLLYFQDLFRIYINDIITWLMEAWFYLSGIFCIISSEKHLNIPYNWVISIIGILNSASYIFIQSDWWLLLYVFALEVFILHKWRYDLIGYPTIHDYLIIIHGILMLFASFPVANFAFEKLIYIGGDIKSIDFVNIIVDTLFIKEIVSYLWRILLFILEFELYFLIIITFWLHGICGIITFGDVLYRKASSFRERNSKSELKRNKDIFKIIWLYFLIFIVLLSIPISKALTIHIIGSSSFVLEWLFDFLWVWQIGFILEFPDGHMDQFPQFFFMNVLALLIYGFLAIKTIRYIAN